MIEEQYLEKVAYFHDYMLCSIDFDLIKKLFRMRISQWEYGWTEEQRDQTEHILAFEDVRLIKGDTPYSLMDDIVDIVFKPISKDNENLVEAWIMLVGGIDKREGACNVTILCKDVNMEKMPPIS